MSKSLPVLLLITTILLLLVFVVALPKAIFGFGSSSETYNLEGEFGIFGGAKSSENYSLTDTGGGFAVGFNSSGNYEGCSGFQCVLSKVPTITFSISTNSVNLGSLSTGSVSTASHTISVSTVLTTGYTVRVADDGNLRDGSNDINDVGDGAVSAGSEEYGLATSKAGQNIVQDTSCGAAAYSASAITTSLQSVASSTIDVTNDSTTLCYAASISSTTPSGIYQHTLTYIATGTF